VTIIVVDIREFVEGFSERRLEVVDILREVAFLPGRYGGLCHGKNLH
jgi:hypothetical protein